MHIAHTKSLEFPADANFFIPLLDEEFDEVDTVGDGARELPVPSFRHDAFDTAA